MIAIKLVTVDVKSISAEEVHFLPQLVLMSFSLNILSTGSLTQLALFQIYVTSNEKQKISTKIGNDKSLQIENGPISH